MDTYWRLIHWLLKQLNGWLLYYGSIQKHSLRSTKECTEADQVNDIEAPRPTVWASSILWWCPIVPFFFLNWDGSIPIDTLVGWTSIYQLFWDSLGTRVLTHPQITSRVFLGQWNNGTSPSPPSPYHNVQFFLAGVICPAKCHMVKATFWWVKSELSWVFSPK